MTHAEQPAVIIEVPWRSQGNQVAAVGSAVFAVAIAYLAATSTTFTGIYRAVLAGGADMLAYWTATVVLNRSRVELDESSLRLSHGPLPWLGSCSFSRDEIARVVANPRTRRLELRTRRGEDHVLLTALGDDLIAQMNDTLGPLLNQ